MSKNMKSLLFVSALLATGAMAQGQTQAQSCENTVVRSTAARVTATAHSSVVYKIVQQTPQYDLRRPEVISGARVTLFANFLRNEPGVVLFNLNGTSTECVLVEWRPNSVTIELPRLGLLEPKNAEIQIVLPDGRIAKTFPVLFIAQPDIVIHQDTVPQPMPPAPAARAAAYATPVRGGLMLQSVTE
jgi:hypothetical protein